MKTVNNDEQRVTRTLLLAEDDLDVRESMAMLISRLGWSVTEADDGVDAIEKFKASPTDVVLTDLMMPRMDGMQVLKEIHEINREVPVIVLTGNSTMERCRTALKSGAADFLAKPCKKQEISRVLDRAYNGRISLEGTSELQDLVNLLLSLNVPADIEKRKAIILQLGAIAKSVGFGEKYSTIRLAVDEAFTNAVKHGSSSDKGKTIEIKATFVDQKAVITITDTGEGFDSSLVTAAKLDASSGRGIFLLKAFCNEVKWLDKGNICEMSFVKTD